MPLDLHVYVRVYGHVRPGERCFRDVLSETHVSGPVRAPCTGYTSLMYI